MKARTIVAVVVGFAFVTLLVIHDPQARRRTLIERALKEGTIGLLTENQKAKAEPLLNRWAQDAGLQQPVVLDHAFKSGALHVFSTGPASDKLTRNTRGNALYDPALDSIFVDHTLFGPQVVGLSADGIYMKEAAGPTEYLHFLYLHELGHKILHRVTSKSDQTKLEDEADDFAFRILANSPNSRASELGYFNMSAFIVPGSHTEQAQPYLVDLAGSVLEIAGLTLFSSAPFSPFYSDPEHIPFIERAIRVARRIGALAQSSATRNYAFYVEKDLNRIKSSQLSVLTEVRSTMPVAAVQIAADRLLVFAEVEHNHVGEYKSIAWTPAKSKQRGPNNHLAVSFGAAAKPPVTKISSNVVTVVSDHHGLPAVYSDESGLYRTEAGIWKKVYEPASFIFDNSVAPTKILIGCEGRTYWCVLNGTIEESRFPARVIGRFLRDAGELDGKLNYANPVALKQNHAYFVVSKKNSEHGREIGRGILVVDTASGNPVEFRKLVFPNTEVSMFPEALSSRIFLMNVRGRETAYAVTTNFFDDKEPFEVKVWLLSEDGAPVMVAKADLLRQELGRFEEPAELGLESRTFNVVKVTPLQDESGALINVNGDSIYHYDAGPSTLRAIAHPGGIQVVVGPRGRFALYVPGGSKIYAGEVQRAQ